MRFSQIIGIVFVLVFFTIGVWAISDPAAWTRFFLKGREHADPDDPEHQFFVRFAGCIIVVLAFIAFLVVMIG